MHIAINLNSDETLNNFNLAEAIAELCRDPNNILDLVTVCKMILLDEERRLMVLKEQLNQPCRRPNDDSR